MLVFNEVRIPVDEARALAIATDHRTALDDGYAIKAYLAETFGPDALRPWRVVATEDDEFVVVGVVRDAESMAKPTSATVRRFQLEPSNGDALVVEIMSTATTRVREPLRKGGWLRREVDVASVRDPVTGWFGKGSKADQRAVYSKWLIAMFSREDSGVRPIDVPEILSTAPHMKVRKAKGEARPLLVPCVLARLHLRVEDAEAFSRLLTNGVQKMKDIGYGAVLPVDLLEEVGA